MVEYVLLIVVGGSDILRFARWLMREWKAGPLDLTFVWWCTQLYRIGGNIGVVLIGFSAWFPTGPIGWSLCGIAMCCGTQAPCGFAFIRNSHWLWFIRNLIFGLFSIGAFAVAAGWLR